MRQRGGGDVGEDQQVVVLQLGQGVRHPAGRADVDLHVLLFQGPGQVLGLVGVALDQQHPRLAGGRDQAEVAVVVQQRVAVAAEPGRDRGQPALLDRLLEDDPVLALLELERLVGDLDVAAVDLDAALVVVVVAVDQDLDVERLALQDLRGDVHGRELDLGVGADRAAATVETSTLPCSAAAALKASPAVGLPSEISTILGT